MMKFFRKYNKHLLAVFMALLLVIWLGGTALEQMVRPDPGKRVLGADVSGAVTFGDRELAESQARLQRTLGLNWEERFRDPTALPNEQLTMIDWVLLQREAKRYGIKVTSDRARTILTELGMSEASIRQGAARLDVATRHVYEAAAQYFAVDRMLTMFQSALLVPEPQLRLLARNVLELAAVEVAILPAEVFADPEETFTEAELSELFEKHKNDKSGRGGLNFGYFIEPQVKIEYLKISPAVLRDHLRGSESAHAKQAFAYWKANRKDARFERSIEEMEALRAAAADATSNGAEATTRPAPVISPFYETFAEARSKAVEAVKDAEAAAEADRIANKIAQTLKEPWFDVQAKDNEYKAAPDQVKNADYYANIVSQLPVNLRHPAGIEVGTVDWISAADLAKDDGIGAASWRLPDGGALPVSRLAFNVEGLVEIPEDVRSGTDRQLYLSLWETMTSPLVGPDGTLYLYRVTDAREGRAPTGLDEVADLIAADLRIVHGMERATEAARKFAADVGTAGLKSAWEKDSTLADKITPDEGGYVDLSPFPRDASEFVGIENYVLGLGIVTDEFIDKSFELAAQGAESAVEVVALPDQAQVVVIKGQDMQLLYEEMYQAQRQRLQQSLIRQRAQEILFNWVNAKHVRERNQWTLGAGA